MRATLGLSRPHRITGDAMLEIKSHLHTRAPLTEKEAEPCIELEVRGAQSVSGSPVGPRQWEDGAMNNQLPGVAGPTTLNVRHTVKLHYCTISWLFTVLS